MALVHAVQTLGTFDHGTSDAKARADLEQLFETAGEEIPNRIPVSRAIEILVKEAQQSAPPPAARRDMAPAPDGHEPTRTEPGSGGPTEPQETAAATPTPAFTADEVGIDERLGQSVPRDIVLRDEDGKVVSLGSLIDKPTLLTPQLLPVRRDLHASAQRRR